MIAVIGSPGRARVASLAAALALVCVPVSASAFSIGTQLDEDGCHEPITAQALRNARAKYATAPAIAPTRDEAALIADVMWKPPADFVPDLAAMSLLLGVRSNDVKDKDPLAAIDIVPLQGDPATQEEHCVRAAAEDGDLGARHALLSCRAFILTRATEALAGLAADGTVDPSVRMNLGLWLSIRGQANPSLPLFYVKMGQAMHALEDGFPHTYRTADGMKVTTVLNWIDLVGTSYDPTRDGPPHRVELDHCHAGNALVERNVQLAIAAATELLEVALDPSRSREDKIAAFDLVTAKYLSFQDGCSADNAWCHAPEADVQDPGPVGCDAGGGRASSWAVLAIVAVALVLRRRRGIAAAGGALASLVLVAGIARADGPATPATPPETPVSAPATATAPTPAQQPTEPGRDEKTPTPAEVRSVRVDKRLGPAWGFTASAGASVDRAAGVATIGVRYRLNEFWLVGVDAGWNPWITTSPMHMTNGVLNVYATVIRRYPMKFDRVNLRTSLHLGTSTLLFDVYGAPQYSTGIYGAVSPLGIDYDLGGSLRIVFDPAEFAIPVPELGQLPLWYEQVRFMLGIQYGA